VAYFGWVNQIEIGPTDIWSTVAYVGLFNIRVCQIDIDATSW